MKGKEKGFVDAEIVGKAIRDGWVRVVNVQTEKEFEEIEKGESEAIELASRESLYLLVDDSTARAIATSLGVKSMGALRVLYLAVKNGLISKSDAKKTLNLMISEGFRLLSFFEILRGIGKVVIIIRSKIQHIFSGLLVR